MIYSARNWPAKGLIPLFTYFVRGDGCWFAVAQDGRYDTSDFDVNRPRDSDIIRWRIAGRPWLSLPAQTYMRDYYQPDLTAKLLDCEAADDCAQTLRAVSKISRLDWVAPKIAALEVRPGLAPNSAQVNVRVSEGSDPAALG